MGLPSPEQLNQLSGLILKQGQYTHGAWGKFKSVLASLTAKLAPAAVQAGVSHGAAAAGVSSGLQVGFTVGSVAVGTAIAPIGAALAPWIGAAVVATQAGKIFSLHDLKADALRGGSRDVNYSCACRKCAKNIGYIIDKKERNVALVAIGVGTLGASAILKGFHSLGKKLYSAAAGETRPKETVSREVVESARGGCTTAMGAVFLLSGSWSFTGNRDSETMATAVAIITSADGWEKLKSLW
ncbi:MAG: hypothetical protein ACFCVH_14650 [Alphaproteobacteria bacterium]